jgi:hypothetical protein
MKYNIWLIMIDWMNQNDPDPIPGYVMSPEFYWAAPMVYQLTYPGDTPLSTEGWYSNDPDVGLGNYLLRRERQKDRELGLGI